MEFKEKALIEKIEAEEQEHLRQQILKAKHGIEDENVVVVEKFSIAKFLVKTLVRLIRILAEISLLILAALGLIALIYEETRQPIFEIIQNGFYMFS